MVVEVLTLCWHSKNNTMKFHEICRKTDFFPKKPSHKNGFVCQCVSSLTFFHWSNLFSYVKSIFTDRIYFVAYMVHVPVPQNLIFSRKIPRSKKALFVNVGVAESIFTGQIHFLWPKKALFVNVGVAESILTGQIF